MVFISRSSDARTSTTRCSNKIVARSSHGYTSATCQGKQTILMRFCRVFLRLSVCNRAGFKHRHLLDFWPKRKNGVWGLAERGKDSIDSVSKLILLWISTSGLWAIWYSSPGRYHYKCSVMGNGEWGMGNGGKNSEARNSEFGIKRRENGERGMENTYFFDLCQ